MTHTVTSLDALERIPVSHGLEWRPIRRLLGIRSFGVNAYTAEKVGDWIVEEHTEERLRHQEVYFVLRGRARFTLDGEEVDAPAGTIVFISDPDITRVAVAEEERTAVLAIGGKPGQTFVPSAWEWYFAAYAQPVHEGIATMEAGLRELGERAPLLYHLACLEARAGRLDDARAHLARAIELDPTVAELAATDDDLKDVR
jgi:hypothetical protein